MLFIMRNRTNKLRLIFFNTKPLAKCSFHDVFLRERRKQLSRRSMAQNTTERVCRSVSCDHFTYAHSVLWTETSVVTVARVFFLASFSLLIFVKELQTVPTLRG